MGFPVRVPSPWGCRGVRDEGEVQIRGTRGGLLIRLDGEEDFQALKAKLAERLAAAQKFFHGSAVTIDVGRRVLTTRELLELEGMFSARYGVRLLQVINGAVEEEAGPAGLPASGRSEVCEERPAGRDRWPADTVLVKRTVRSGQRIACRGNLVVLGDVNPGAEVVAGGDVVVMGNLRGVVHAGAGGDGGAVVVAWRLRPTQLRIGNLITRPPDGDGAVEPGWPEMARVRDGEIVIDPFPEPPRSGGQRPGEVEKGE